MERLLTTMPSFNSSPRMRSVPQRGFSCEIREISAFSSALRRGRPSRVRDLHVQSPALPVPAQDRLRLHDPKVLVPALRPEVAKPDPEDSIRSAEAGMRVCAQGDLELVAEDQVLQRQIPAGSNGSDERTKHDEE